MCGIWSNDCSSSESCNVFGHNFGSDGECMYCDATEQIPAGI